MAWESTADDKKSEILHANDDHAFRWACLNGYHEIAEWLWGICPEEQQSEMLHAANDHVFRWACNDGLIDIAKWLWSKSSDDKKSKMLHAGRDRNAFWHASGNDHQDLAKWIFSLYEHNTIKDAADRLKQFKKINSPFYQKNQLNYLFNYGLV